MNQSTRPAPPNGLGFGQPRAPLVNMQNRTGPKDAATVTGAFSRQARAKLIAVAAQLVEEKGYEGATLQDLARRSGMGNGAVYGNFKNRDDLLAAIGPTYWPQIRPVAAPGASLPEIMQAVAEALIAAMPARTRVGASRMRGLAYTLTNDGLKAHASEIRPGATPQPFSGGANGSRTRRSCRCRRRTSSV